VICVRAANYRTPLRALVPDTVGARYHRGTEPEPTQYLALHPLGPAAEVLRNRDFRLPEQARALELRIWALDVPADGLVEVPFAAELVGDDPESCRRLADDLRAEGARGAIVPSAALPGTRNVVLFGARNAAPWLARTIGRFDVRASIAGENAEALVALLPLVRFRGRRPPSAEPVFREPSWAR
jgi:hypothetical protein